MAQAGILDNGDIPARSSIHNMLAQQASVHLAGKRLAANPRPKSHELIWVADRMMQQHWHKPVLSGELYSQIGGRSFLIGLLVGALYKITPGGAWWRFTLPEVADEVLVAFEHGDIGRPYVIGSLWENPKDSPTQEKRARKHASGL